MSGRYVDAHSPLWILLHEEANGEMSVALPAGFAFAPRLTHHGFYISSLARLFLPRCMKGTSNYLYPGQAMGVCEAGEDERGVRES